MQIFCQRALVIKLIWFPFLFQPGLIVIYRGTCRSSRKKQEVDLGWMVIVYLAHWWYCLYRKCIVKCTLWIGGQYEWWWFCSKLYSHRFSLSLLWFCAWKLLLCIHKLKFNSPSLASPHTAVLLPPRPLLWCILILKLKLKIILILKFKFTLAHLSSYCCSPSSTAGAAWPPCCSAANTW